MTKASRTSTRPTLSDIARVVETSEATVSRALRGSPEISEQTRGLIRRVARDLGYVPNAAARSLVRQTSLTLGLIVPDVTDPIHGLIIAGFGRAAERHGYTVIVLEGSGSNNRRMTAIRTLREHQAQGIAFCGAPVSSREASEKTLPAHTVFILPEGQDAVSQTDESLGRIMTDSTEGMRLLIEHLIGSGRRQLSYINGPDIASNRIRRNAILKALEQMGIEPRIREYETTLEQADLDNVASLVARERPDALLCYDDKMALYLLDALRRFGLRVPDDVAVTGFDGIPFAAISNPRLTTVVQPAEKLGEMAGEMLCEAIKSGKAQADVICPVELAIRESSHPKAVSGGPQKISGDG